MPSIERTSEASDRQSGARPAATNYSIDLRALEAARRSAEQQAARRAEQRYPRG